MNTTTTIKTEDLKKMLNLFVGTDELRPDLCKPFFQKGNFIATDAYTLILIPPEGTGLHFPEQEKPNVYNSIPPNDKESREINIHRLIEKLPPVLIDEYRTEETKCSECKGKGEVECDHCGQDTDCEDCNGIGVFTKNIPTGKKIQDEEAFYTFLGVGYKYRYLNRLIEACKIAKTDTIQQVRLAENSANVFMLGNIKILIMPLVINSESEYHVIEY